MAQTHDLAVSGASLVKRYTSWDRGEHRREWAVLNHLQAHMPGLVPVPLHADLDAEPPSIRMSVLPGEPLRGELTRAQLDALDVALRALWSVPVGGLPPRRFCPAEAWQLTRTRFAVSRRPGGIAGVAFDAAGEFLRGAALSDGSGQARQVVGHSDPNLANYLWDGETVRLVDFEDAGRSDVAYELATLVEHLSARGTDWKRFLARFDVDAARVLAARRLAASLWLTMLLPGGVAARRNPPDTLERQAERLLALMA